MDEIVERHQVKVAAPADITFSTACAMDLQDSAIIRAIFKARELLLCAKPQQTEAMANTAMPRMKTRRRPS